MKVVLASLSKEDLMLDLHLVWLFSYIVPLLAVLALIVLGVILRSVKWK